jgi:ADP-glucose pyrophosphorylase
MQLRVLAFVLAGGKGTRLYPLTKERAKPAVPFGGQYRIVDFVLSNLANSGIYSIYVLIQVPALRIIRILIRKRLIRRRKPPLRPREVPGPEIIQPGLYIPFLGGEPCR